MIRGLLSRVVLTLGIVVGASMLLFLAAEVLPGDLAGSVLGPQASPEAVAQLRAEAHLDDPLTTRYLSWASDAVRGDFGNSYATGAPVLQEIAQPLRDTVVLALLALLVSTVVSIGLGTVCGMNAGGRIDRICESGAVLVVAIPAFVLGSLLVLIFSTWMGLAPPVVMIPFGGSPLSAPGSLILPVLTLSAFPAAWGLRLVSVLVEEADRSPHVMAARLSGLSTARILRRHLLPTIAAPIAQIVGWSAAGIFSGTALVEQLFNYPGLSGSLIEAVHAHDAASLEAIGLIMVTIVAVTMLVADLIGPDSEAGTLTGSAQQVLGRVRTRSRLWQLLPLAVLVAALLLPVLPSLDPGTVSTAPFSAPSGAHPLGTDIQGRDVLARFFDGGRPLIVLPFVATALTGLLGIALGAAAVELPDRLRGVGARLDLALLALPPILVILIVLNGWGIGPFALTAAVVITGLPYSYRLTYTATMEHLGYDYVRQAAALGDGAFTTFWREILPGVLPRVLADAGTRLAIAISLIASVSFLGFGPDAPNWSGMISTNIQGLTLNPWATVVPAVAVAALTLAATTVLRDVSQSPR